MTKKKVKEIDRSNHEEMFEKMIAAGRKHFMHFGVSRTTMTDISRSLGIPRQALYEYVSSRDDIVEASLKCRIKEIGEKLRPVKVKSFDDSFIETTLAAIRFARNDKELMNLVSSAPKEMVQEVVVGKCDDIHQIVLNLFEPILEYGQKTGKIRKDKSNDEIVDWLRLVFLALITQTKIGPDQEYDLVSSFLLPSLMFSTNNI